jgi:hypothetical protein
MFWIDAFCVPVDPMTKTATLESMGFIYSRAIQVVVVLSEESFTAVETMMGQLDTAKVPGSRPECLDVLEKDAWIRSVWTYQEVVNSQRLIFTGEGIAARSISGQDFLNHFGHYVDTWRRANGYSAFEFREKYPFLDAFESVVLDWRVVEYEERCALHVMSQTDNRLWISPSNIFYSMIGAITSKPSRRKSGSSIESLAEAFMNICEDKGDYSFIYSATKRDERPGYEWRPAPQILRSLLPWPCLGDAQRGERDPQGIRLKDMAILERSASVGEKGTATLLWCLKEYTTSISDSDSALIDKYLAILRKIGFTGSEDYLVTTHGIFFPQHRVAPDLDVVLWVSTAIGWRIATPGLAVVSDGRQKIEYVPGIFGGSVPDDAVTVIIETS